MQPIKQAMPGALASILRAAPLSPGKVEFAWRAAVGPAFQRVTAVRLEGSVLLVDVSTGHWAREVRRASGLILGRVQALLGAETVKSVTVRAVDRA